MEVEIGNPDTMTEQVPKRGPGRPRKDGSPAQPRKPRKSTVEARKQASEICTALVAMGQVATVSVLTQVLQKSVDESDYLTEDEMVALGDAISAEMLASVRARKWLDRAVKVSPHLALMQVAFAIAVPRLQRHGIIPGGMHERSETDTTVPMETGGTPSDSGRYWFGENNTGTNPFDALGLHHSAPV